MKKLTFIMFLMALAVLPIAGCSRVINNSQAYSYNREKADLSFVEGNKAFAFDIFREINAEDRDQSVFISPLSISTALSMTYQGARGTTKDSMAEALGYKEIDIEGLNESYKNLLLYLMQDDSKLQLSINNSIWIREGNEVAKDFLAVNRDAFNSYIAEVDFTKENSIKEINKWIDDATKGKISEMVQYPVSEDTLMYLINAIYFKGDWTNKFDIKNTFSSEFVQGDGNKQQADMMSKTGKFDYSAGNDYEVVRLPYGDGNTAMYCILPNEGIEINEFIELMSIEKWDEIKKGISTRNDVLVQIPRFKLQYGIKELENSLTKLGMGEAFSDFADFTGIRENVAISSVLHKAIIEVNEEGSEAAAATVVEVGVTSAMPNPITFIANRPFMFIIANDETDTILFMGKLLSI